MYGYQSPELTLLIHRAELQEELQRRHPEHYHHFRAPHRHVDPLVTLRSRVGGALIALGTRIAPAAQTDRTHPAMGTMSVAR